MTVGSAHAEEETADDNVLVLWLAGLCSRLTV